MIPGLRKWWRETRASFWFAPALIVLGAVALAAGLIALDANVVPQLNPQWPLLFGAGASGSRSLLTAVAGSMITVAGVVFSMTLVALSLTSSQYTSRLLGNFMRDRMNQIVLGVFVGIFAYCLVVLRAIRSGDEGAFVPSLAVLGGVILAFVGIGFLIYFIHHVSVSIQASSILAAVARETIAAVDRLFPDELAEGADENADDDPTRGLEERTWSAVGAPEMGYVESIEGEELLALSRKHGAVVRMERGIGEFVAAGAPLISLAGPGKAPEVTADELRKIYVISRHRTVEQDAGFGIRQLVDIGMKALSPGVNDTTTAVMCVDYLGAILARLAARGMVARHRLEGNELRVIARGPSFESLLGEAFDQLRQNAGGNAAVLERQLQALEIVAGHTSHPRRRQALRRHAELIAAAARASIPSAYDRAGAETASLRLAKALAGS